MTSAASAGLEMSLPSSNLFLRRSAVCPIPNPLSTSSLIAVGSCCGVSGAALCTTLGSGIASALGPRLLARASKSPCACAIVCANGEGCLAKPTKSVGVSISSLMAALSFAWAVFTSADSRCCANRSWFATALSPFALLASASLVGKPSSPNKPSCLPFGSLTTGGAGCAGGNSPEAGPTSKPGSCICCCPAPNASISAL